MRFYFALFLFLCSCVTLSVMENLTVVRRGRSASETDIDWWSILMSEERERKREEREGGRGRRN